VIISAFIIILLDWQGSVQAVSAKIMSRDCKRLVDYQSSTECKPSIYVRGRKVRVADVGGGSNYKMPKEFPFNIGVDIEGKYDRDIKI